MRRTLVLTVAIPVSLFQRQRLQEIDREDFAPVIRKTREDLAKQNIVLNDEDGDAGILALKQYYAVALLDPLNMHAVSDAIDPFWHAHILHTKQYIAFCGRVFGQYIQHEPLDRADTARVTKVAQLYRYTADIYAKMFDHIDRLFYPINLPDARMICVHHKVEVCEVREHALFPAVAVAA